MIEIDKTAESFGTTKLLPWHLMAVGESFTIPWSEEDRKLVASRIGALAYQQKRRYGRTYSYRSLESGLRVWRVS